MTGIHVHVYSINPPYPPFQVLCKGSSNSSSHLPAPIPNQITFLSSSAFVCLVCWSWSGAWKVLDVVDELALEGVYCQYWDLDLVVWHCLAVCVVRGHLAACP